MSVHIRRITQVAVVGTYSLRVDFDDGVQRVVDLEPMLRGALFAPLRDPAEFAKVAIDAECGVLVWPCGADLDPATLHDWPEVGGAMAALAATWA
ncbi:MAG: DUF2442 domain-containing protein [Deltaproteobacteria bacterium]|nr:DUF2442 domain-containing protein [Deltaproteobacteria bacterium]